jgi:hypothetical protein
MAPLWTLGFLRPAAFLFHFSYILYTLPKELFESSGDIRKGFAR